MLPISSRPLCLRQRPAVSRVQPTCDPIRRWLVTIHKLHKLNMQTRGMHIVNRCARPSSAIYCSVCKVPYSSIPALCPEGGRSRLRVLAPPRLKNAEMTKGAPAHVADASGGHAATSTSILQPGPVGLPWSFWCDRSAAHANPTSTHPCSSPSIGERTCFASPSAERSARRREAGRPQGPLPSSCSPRTWSRCALGMRGCASQGASGHHIHPQHWTCSPRPGPGRRYSQPH